MIAGHFTVTFAVRGALKDKLPVLRPLYPLLLGAVLPDMVDKPVWQLLGGPPRGIAHSVAALALGFYILFRLIPRHRTMLATAAVGAAFHLIEDWPYPYIFAWPLLGGWEFFPLKDIGDTISVFYKGETHPYLLAVEVASWPLCIYYWMKSRLPSIAVPDELPQP